MFDLLLLAGLAILPGASLLAWMLQVPKGHL